MLGKMKLGPVSPANLLIAHILKLEPKEANSMMAYLKKLEENSAYWEERYLSEKVKHDKLKAEKR